LGVHRWAASYSKCRRPRRRKDRKTKLSRMQSFFSFHRCKIIPKAGHFYQRRIDSALLISAQVLADRRHAPRPALLRAILNEERCRADGTGQKRNLPG
jgi:hypothetical protein